MSEMQQPVVGSRKKRKTGKTDPVTGRFVPFGGAHNHSTGKRHSPTYSTWHLMIQRCRNPKATGFDRYGSRGIAVCEVWSDFTTFLRDMGLRPSLNHSIERINNDGNYEPGNCRWATRAEQMRNTSNNVRLEFNGRVQTSTDWANELGVKVNTLIYRMRRGWSVERALTQFVEVRRSCANRQREDA